jgi:transcriptional regulator GlxA family with amidase domain
MATTNPVNIAVLLLPPIQLLDASPIDLFGMLTKEYLSACNLPRPLIAGAVPISIIYVSEAGIGTIAECTANAGLRVTASLSDESVVPGKTNILLIPGPDPSTVPSEAVTAFIKNHAEQGTTIMTVCTGVFVAGYAGILNGKRATGPRALLPELRRKFPKATWEDCRWVSDGNVWCSGTYFSIERYLNVLSELTCG